jgi:hypothetical protein
MKAHSSAELLQASSRNLAFQFAQIMASVLMFEFAEWCVTHERRPSSILAAQRFAYQNFSWSDDIAGQEKSENERIAFAI